MGMWSCAASQDRRVRLWLPTLLKDGWPAVRQALIAPDQISVALAAAIIVAATLGKPDPEMPAPVAQWLKHNPITPDPKLIQLALAAIDRAEAHHSPEWAESDEEFGYQTAANELRHILGRPSQHHLSDTPES
jgi:hypothetical protein